MKIPCIKLSNNYFRVLLVFFGIISLIKIILSFLFPTPWIFSDEGIYDSVARNIFLSKSLTEFSLTRIYPPGYSIFLSIAYEFSTNKTIIYHIMLILNALITSSIIFPSWYIFKKYTNEQFSLFGALIVTTLPSSNLYSFTLMSENLFIPLTVFSFWLIIQSFELESPYWDIITGFSIFYLFFTRSTGVAMILGLFMVMVYYVYINPHSQELLPRVKSKLILLMSCVIPIILWIIIKRTLPTPSSIKYDISFVGYDLSSYTQSFFDMFCVSDNLFNTISLFINEIGFLILASYFLMFFFAIFLFLILFTPHITESMSVKNCLDLPKNMKLMLKVQMVYFITIAVTLLLITITHMHISITKGDDYYHIFGRYIDPLVPIIFIFGFISIYYFKNSFQVRKSLSLIIIAISGLILIFFSLVFPITYYKFPNMLSIYYIEHIHEILPMDVFYLLFFILIILLVFFLQSSKKYILFIISMLFLSIAIMYPIYHDELIVSKNTEAANQIGRYLQQHSDYNTKILMDRENFNEYWGPNMWFLSEFWSQGIMVRTSSPLDPSGVYSTIANQSEYIISKKLLPYSVVNQSAFGYKLYMLKTQKEPEFYDNFTSFIDIGYNDDYYIENFYPAEKNQFRWTKNNSKILIEYPRKCGELNLSIKMGGIRPLDDPANVHFSINNYPIGNITYFGDDRVVSILINNSNLNDQYHILGIVTNTWNPVDYGSIDNRDLGIQVDWLLVQSCESKTLKISHDSIWDVNR